MYRYKYLKSKTAGALALYGDRLLEVQHNYDKYFNLRLKMMSVDSAV